MINAELDMESWHDVVVSVLNTLEITDKSYSDYAKLVKLYNKVPHNIRSTAVIWGSSDTVFRDDAYVWLLANWHKLDLKTLDAHEI